MDPTAKSLEYYLGARQIIENALVGRTFKPRRWENYRPLWYSTYNRESLTGDAFDSAA